MDSTLSIRRAGPADDHVIARVSRLDSALPLAGPKLVAEVDGEIVAAISLENGTRVADPFRPTASIVEVLRLRRAQLGTAPNHRRARPYWLS
jgi:hypothetical protein